MIDHLFSYASIFVKMVDIVNPSTNLSHRIKKYQIVKQVNFNKVKNIFE